MVKKLNVYTVDVGEVLEVQFPNSVQRRPSFLGMVTEIRTGSVDLIPIELGVNDEPRTSIVGVSQTELGLSPLNPSRVVMYEHPEYRRWVDNPIALMSFTGYPPPRIPERLTLEELARYQDGRFILAGKAPLVDRDMTAQYRTPFYDHLNGKIVRQRVTVFRLNGGARMAKHREHPTAQDWRPVLPEGVTFTQIDEGPVFRGDQHGLTLGTRATRMRDHNLQDGSLFAIETEVLVRAGHASR